MAPRLSDPSTLVPCAEMPGKEERGFTALSGVSLLRRGWFPSSGSPALRAHPSTRWLSLLPSFSGAGGHPDRWGTVTRQVLSLTGTSVSPPHSRSSERRGRMRSTAVPSDISALRRDGEPGINVVRLHGH